MNEDLKPGQWDRLWAILYGDGYTIPCGAWRRLLQAYGTLGEALRVYRWHSEVRSWLTQEGLIKRVRQVDPLSDAEIETAIERANDRVAMIRAVSGSELPAFYQGRYVGSCPRGTSRFVVPVPAQAVAGDFLDLDYVPPSDTREVALPRTSIYVARHYLGVFSDAPGEVALWAQALFDMGKAMYRREHGS